MIDTHNTISTLAGFTMALTIPIPDAIERVAISVISGVLIFIATKAISWFFKKHIHIDFK